ncbi:hypothetical protein J4Q44_G00338980 [Coregonus suidteri]|uniref:Cytoplasmic dynein 2 heavy chain 1 n=1 Tax=Coregonus suidteri TaxID=861788 RepID=A0AAN8L2E3_9TELE
METLSSRPESIDEIGEANSRHSQIHARKPDILPQFQAAEEKNRLLRAVAGGGLDSLSSLRAKWDKLELMMESHQLMIKEQVEVMRSNAESRIQAYRLELDRFRARWDQLKPRDEVIETGDQAALLASVQTIRDKKQEDCRHFELEAPDFSLAEETIRDMEEYGQMWSLYEDWQEDFQKKAKEDWITFRRQDCFAWQDRLRKLEQHTSLSVKLQREVDKYKSLVPVLKYVRGEHLSQDHWLDLFRLLGLPKGTTLERLTFWDLLSVADTITDRALELKDLNSRAQAEVTIREALRELDLWGAGAAFTLTEYTDSAGHTLTLIKDWKDVVNQVGDNRCLLQSLKDSPYYRGFQDKVSLWEVRLSDLDEYLVSLNAIQRRWVYLEPIFGRGALPREQARFKRVDEDFRSILADVQRDSRVTSLSSRAGIRNSLITILDQLQRCQKSLNEFLEEKRSAFPRFYFIGDDDLLEILGQATNPTVIQSHLKKLFAGINSVDFDGDCQHIVAMRSLEGEVVPLRNLIRISNSVEVWLGELSAEMKETLKQLLCECVSAGRKGEVDPSRYPSQGNAAKLVHTPLTDKCYLTLTQAMMMGLGGNPYGPAGTGKTESVKALGGLFGRQVLVFNCDEGIDVKSMGRIFVGLVKTTGPSCELLGKEVELDPNSGVFITLNPAGKGYGGRQKLPDNLKQLFRPVAMSRPDNELIAEVILYSEGFKDGEILGRKLVAIFNLARELLTPQQHYDWGLRALKTVLRGCGSLLQQQRRSEAKNKNREQLQTIYSAYLQPVLQRSLGSQAAWASTGKTHQLAGSLVQVYEQVKAKFTVDDHSHYLFTPCVLTQWVLSLLRYDLTAESSVLQLKLKALILDIIHNISVVKQLCEEAVSSPDAWAWRKQLRFYLDNDRRCSIQMVDAHFSYTYEYQGNAAKLVHTPLTDKCYLTLTQAMMMGLGGNPYGPAGTGKTESVKALGGLFGRQVLVFNCDEGIDVKSMGRIFVGLVKCGAWGCFDEFNRLEEAVLSAVSMQIQGIQNSLKNHRTSCELLGKEVELDPNSGVFITLNPAGKGYGGRQKLPDNLKQLFRPVAMSRPDNELIAEVILYSEGFKDGEILGRKLVAIFNLARELLTPQQHYDWGLRALKTVLRGCGSLLQQQRRSEAKNKIKESVLVVQALRLNTMSKLTFADSSRFDALVQDVFPGVGFTDVEDQTLSHALQAVYEEAHLQLIPSQMKKALELCEQLRQRMGVVIVGPSGAGKSTLWRMLRAALGRTGRVVKQYTVNPKAMPRQQLLGHIDMDTREWTDGVLTNSARQVVREPQEVSSWIICDGDIDPEWIESLNSVLDDNRLLTMPSGERIQFGPNINFVFETHDLSCASPATISRMGMIFLSDEDTDVSALVKSWLKGQPDECRSNLENWMGDYFHRGLDWVLKQTSLVGTVLNGLSHLSGVTERGQFVVSLIRGLGGNLNLKSRQDFAKEVLGWARESPPDPRKPLDTYYDPESGRLCAYSLERPDGLSLEEVTHTHTLPVIQTPDMQRGLHCFSHWLSSQHRQPFILVGPEGCGKGMLLRYAFSRLRSTQVAVVHCSAQTSSRHVLQKLSQTCLLLSSNTGRAYRPKDCENLVLYLKDINLPKPDKWGTSNLIAFLQQVLTYHGFYDENLEWVGLENVQVVASMSAGGAVGRHTLTSRFTSIVRICTIE